MVGTSEDWDAPETYDQIAGDRQVTIAITDDGWVWAWTSLLPLRPELIRSRLADSVRVSEDGSTMFVKALDEQLSMATFLARLSEQHPSA
jgi:hypothetical protein